MVHSGAMTMQPPGWYPDASLPGYERWWDGNAWSPVTRAVPDQTGLSSVFGAPAASPSVLAPESPASQEDPAPQPSTPAAPSASTAPAESASPWQPGAPASPAQPETPSWGAPDTSTPQAQPGYSNPYAQYGQPDRSSQYGQPGQYGQPDQPNPYGQPGQAGQYGSDPYAPSGQAPYSQPGAGPGAGQYPAPSGTPYAGPGYPSYPQPGESPYGATPYGSAPYGAAPGPQASRFARLVARIVDNILVGIVAAIIGAPFLREIVTVFRDYVESIPTDGSEPPDPSALTSELTGPLLKYGLIATLISGAYYVTLTALRGATLGKSLLGLKVQRLADQAKPTWTDSLLRWATTDLPGLIPSVGGIYSLLDSLWCLWDPKRQCLHDKLPKTLVVRSR
jgi:uncharacterized RDD family membrane protein YckC